MAAKKLSKRIEDIYPLSPMQQGLLFHSLYDPDSPVYSERYTYKIEGTLNLASFRKAWEHLGKSHPVFRTIFRWEGLDAPIQVVVKDRFPKLDIHDLRSSNDKECDAYIAKFHEEDKVRSFDLSKGPLMRLNVFILPDETFYFVWFYHHILMDGWCLSLVMTDLFMSYISAEQGLPMPDIGRPLYKNYIGWLKKQDKDVSIRWWTELLQDFSSPTPLPLDHRSSDRKFNDFSDCTKIFTNEETLLFQNRAKEMRVTLSTLVQAAWAVLLGNYSREQDVVFGVTISGRPVDLSDADKMIGLFINTLPIRADLSLTVSELLQQLQTRSLKMQEYGFSFLPDVKGCSAVSPMHNLFDSLVIFENYPTDFSGMDIDTDLRILDFAAQEMTHYDLTLVIRPHEQMELVLEYAGELFEEETITRMLAHLGNILLNMVKDPSCPSDRLEMTDAEEIEKVVHGFNDTVYAYPCESTLVDLFEARVQKEGARPAVAYGDRVLSYDELNAYSNRLSYRLLSLGVKPGVLVGMMAGTPIESIVSILGILKAGGAYMPIDPEFPVSRIQYMLEDSNAPVVICMEALLSKLPKSVDIVCLDRDHEQILVHNTENPDHVNNVDDIAYAIYTSGSTGKPKGTLVPHKGVVNLAHALYKNIYSLYDGYLRVAQLASFSFDASVQQIFASLLFGHTLYPIPGEMKKDPELLIPYILENRIEVIDGTPSLWELMVGSGVSEAKGLCLKHMVVGGEALPTNLIERFYTGRSGRNVRWTNVYGVTESSVDSASFLVEPGKLPDATHVPIGKPVANTRIYLLDEKMEPVPVGVSGELYIGGDGLAKGYLNNPERTARSFIPDPFNTGSRLYRTGDLGRWLSDGNIDFQGRIDFQVKIRGFRVELGEIESVLSTHPDAEECVVVDKTDESGEKYLMAYYVSKVEIPVPDLRLFLGESLPEYMIPLRFMRLDSLPLNTSGKVDRKSLPEPDELRPEMVMEYIAPRNEIETAVAAIWSEVLGIDRIGIRDNFFDLGGHSLKATRVVSRLKKDMEIEIPLRIIFETPTIEGIVSSIEKNGLEAFSNIEHVPEKDFYELSHAQQRIWFLDQMIPGSPAYNIPIGFVVDGELDFISMEQALQMVVKRHETLRTVFSSHDGGPVQMVLDSLAVVIESEDVSGSNDEMLPKIAMEEAMKPFDLSKGPLFRAKIFRISETSRLFMFTMHHIISDGWSVELLVKELSVCYLAFAKGEKPDFTELRIQYKDFAGWQNRLFQEGVLKNQENYWLDKLGGELPVLDLPGDRSRPLIHSTNGSTFRFCIDPGISSEVKRFSKSRSVTDFMFFLGVLNVLLHKLSGLDDIIVGSPIAGRNHSDLEGLIGFFVNTLALRSDLNGDPRFVNLLEQVKNTCIEAYANQDYPFDKLIDILNPVRDTSRTPIFNIMFSMQDASEIMKPFSTGNLSFRAVEGEQKTSKFDMTLFASDAGDYFDFLVEYNTDLFDVETIERYAGYFTNILSSIIQNPDDTISRFSMMDSNERLKILREFNATTLEYPETSTLVSMFESCAAGAGSRKAVVFEEEALSFEVLNARSNKLAHYLRARGITSSDLVGMMVDSPVESIVTILGILKSGGAYLPIDPDFPSGRIEYMIADSRTPLVICREELVNKLSGIEVICIDRDWDSIDGFSPENPEPVIGASDIAYAIYTSGSTGKPKGTLVPHKGVVNLVHALKKNVYDFYSEPLRVAQLASFSFDASVQQIFASLILGHTLYPIPGYMKKDLGLLIPYILKHMIHVIDGTPSLWELMVGSNISDHEDLLLRHIIIGGEPLPVGLIERFCEGKYGGDVRWTNVYGVTESSVDSTSHLVDLNALKGRTIVPIGKPVANTGVYILDKYMNPLPVGVSGELHIGGDGLAREYLNNPEKTKENFIPDPFNDGELLYKTGDLGCWLPDGNIEFQGRMDFQVKIRGFRIELGEIEYALSEYTVIDDCVVVAREDQAGDKHLIAYYVSEEKIPVSELRVYLGEILPDYMIPSRFIHLSALPLNTSGKVDRNNLPEPDDIKPDSMSVYVAPRNDVEEAIATVWAELLNLERVGIRDNFFDLGGHSLLIMKILAKLQLSHPLTVQDCFDHQTIEELAKKALENIETISRGNDGHMEKEEPQEQILVDIPLSGRKEDPMVILLTGSTGYLGAHLLYELLKKTEAHVFCLIRGENKEHVEHRLKSTVDFYFDEGVLDFSRITPVPGNLEEDGLCLDRQIAGKLLKEVDTVVHSAADVRHFGEYSHFENVNVFGTRRLLDFALKGNCKRFHYISTISISGDSVPNMSQIVFKEIDYDRGQTLGNVYARSKFEAEALVREASHDGLDATIYRVGNLVGTSSTGKFQRSIETNAFYGLIKAIINMGVIPESTGGHFDMTPVDSCRRAIVSLMLFPETSGRCLHLYNSNLITMSNLVKHTRSFGYEIRMLNAGEYISTINAIKESGEAGGSFEKLIPFLSDSLFPKTTVLYDNSIANHFLSSTGFKWPVLDTDLIHKLVDYCVSVGFVNAPVVSKTIKVIEK